MSLRKSETSPLSSGQNLLPEAEESTESDGLAAIRRFIRMKRGEFGLLLPVCNDPTTRDRAIATISSENEGIQYVIRLTPVCLDPLKEVLESLSAKPGDPAAIHVIGLAEAVPSDGSQLGALESLNLRRGQWEALACPVLLWVPEWLLGLILRHAPDFANWRSGSPHLPSSILTDQFTGLSAGKESASSVSGSSSAMRHLLDDRDLRVARMAELEARVFPKSPSLTTQDFQNISELILIYARQNQPEECSRLVHHLIAAISTERQQRLLHRLLSILAETWKTSGRIDMALEATRLLEASSRRCLARNPEHSEWQHDLSISHQKLGDIAVMRGDLNAAAKAYTAAMEIRKALAARDPKNTRWQFDLGISHERLGEIARAQGDFRLAAKAYISRHDIIKALAASDPENTQWQRDTSVSHEKLGDIAVAQGDLSAAATAYTAAMEIRQALTARDPENPQWQRDLSVIHNKIGDIALAQGNLHAAANAYTADVDIARSLVARDPENTEWQRDLFICHGNLGDIAKARGDLPSAAHAYTTRHQIIKALAARDPTNTQWQRDLSASHNKLGDTAVAQGDFPAAAMAYSAAMEITKALAARDPDNSDWQRDLAISHFNFADLADEQGDENEAREHFLQCHDILQALLDQGKYVSPADMKFIAQLKQHLGLE